MYLSSAAQNDTATRIAEWVHENTTDYGAVVIEAGRGGQPDAAVVAIVRNGHTTCAAKVAVHHNRVVYLSKLGTRISYPTTLGDAARIVGGFLSLEED